MPATYHPLRVCFNRDAAPVLAHPSLESHIVNRIAQAVIISPVRAVAVPRDNVHGTARTHRQDKAEGGEDEVGEGRAGHRVGFTKIKSSCWRIPNFLVGNDLN